jgi:hypothetical protein
MIVSLYFMSNLVRGYCYYGDVGLEFVADNLDVNRKD